MFIVCLDKYYRCSSTNIDLVARVNNGHIQTNSTYVVLDSITDRRDIQILNFEIDRLLG